MLHVPDPVDALIDALVDRHRMCPHRAWAMLSRAAERKGLSVAELSASVTHDHVPDGRDREVLGAGR